MATVFRGPLFVSRREISPLHQLRTVVVSGSLLTTVLAPTVAPLPLRAADRTLPLQVQHKAINQALNLDTSRGMPETLRVEALPIGKATTLSAPAILRTYADGSLGTSQVLNTVVVTPPPFLPFDWPDQLDARRTNPAVSQGTPQVLLSALPVGQATPTFLVQPPPAVTASAFAGFMPPPPFVPVGSLPPVPRPQQLTDTSSFQALCLNFIVLPFSNQFLPVPQRPMNITDMSSGIPKALLPEVNPPIGRGTNVLSTLGFMQNPPFYAATQVTNIAVYNDFPVVSIIGPPYHQLGRTKRGVSGFRWKL